MSASRQHEGGKVTAKAYASRRQFFKLAGATGLAAGTLARPETAFAGKLPAPKANVKKLKGGKFPSSSYKATARPMGANDRVLLAHIGIGGMGGSHLADFNEKAKERNTQSVAVCDPYLPRMSQAKSKILEKAAGCGDVQVDKDYRKLLENKDVDAVIISTPEHWHSQIAVHAMDAGKHVYVEKPMSRYLDEGFQIYDTWKRTKRIVQVGAQGCSEPKYHKAREIIAEGKLGPLVSVQTSYTRNSRDGEWNYKIEPEAGPDNLDWDLWLGSAPRRPWNDDARDRFFRYRKYRDYSSGILGDLMPHRIHPILLATGKVEFPRRVACIGTKQVSTDREVEDTVHVVAEFPTGWSFLFIGSTVNEQGVSELIRGHHATLYSAGANLELSPERPFAEEMDGGPIAVDGKGGSHPLHRTDFINAVRAGRDPNCNMELAIRAQALISMAEAAVILGRTVEFDEKRRDWKVI
jgi:predicted dehydrogenase